MIRIDHVTFSYGEENESAGGVQDINLNIEDGQFIVLCGESISQSSKVSSKVSLPYGVTVCSVSVYVIFIVLSAFFTTACDRLQIVARYGVRIHVYLY